MIVGPGLVRGSARQSGLLVAPSVLRSPLTLSRAQVSGVQSSATGADGATLALFGADAPRFQGVARRLLIEGQRINLLTGQDTLVTQSATVTAAAHTLSFWGTGTITLSGASTAGPLVGTGASNRVTLIFTPTAGTLTLTVSGTVTRAQLEAGAFASSYVRSDSGQATRGADLVSVPLSELSVGGNGACTILWSGVVPRAGSFGMVVVDDGTSSNRLWVRTDPTSGGSLLAARALSGASAASSVSITYTPGMPFAYGAALPGDGSVRLIVAGGSVVAVSGGPTSGLTTLRLGTVAVGGAGAMFGETTVFRVLLFPLSDTDLAAAVAALPT